MANDSSFIVRLPKEDLEKFNEVIKKNATNRSELLRQWVKKYIEDNGGNKKMNHNLNTEINNKIKLERQKLLDAGRKIKGKGGNIVYSVLEQYDLSQYDVRVDSNAWRVFLLPKGTLEEAIEEKKELIKMSNKKQNFVKRVKSGEVEKSIRNWVEKHYEDLTVKHSRSFVKSESFYVCYVGEPLVKLSLHNTVFQEIKHGTPFIDLNNYTSTIDLKNDLKRYLK